MTNPGCVDDVDIHHDRRNALNVSRGKFHSLHSRVVTNATCQFNNSVMHFDANCIGANATIALKLRKHIVLKCYVAFHMSFLPRKVIEQMISQESLQPNVGQSWTYAKRDLVTRTMINTEVDQISAVGQSVEIESHSKPNENNPIAYPSWGLLWSEKLRDRSRSAAPLPSEVQDPWGMVLVDPHWAQLQVYERPIPLLPAELRPGWSTTVGTRYMVPGSEQRMPWQ
jgi:hypothetical protein